MYRPSLCATTTTTNATAPWFHRIQMEDDMILTVNHILRYLEESEKLSYRK